MNTTKLKLTNPTDDELSAAVAEHVAGVPCAHKWVPGSKDGRGRRGGAYVCTKCGRRVRGGGNAHGVDPFATSADAVLPLLEKRDAIITHSVKERDWRVVIEGGRCNSAPTLPRAACIALLRANGIEVEQTAPAQK